MRSDIGSLWENFLIGERIKALHYHRLWVNSWFWRTQDQQEIDYIEERDGKLSTWEFKWNPNIRPRLSKTFAKAYPSHEFTVITPDNFEDFICMDIPKRL